MRRSHAGWAWCCSLQVSLVGCQPAVMERSHRTAPWQPHLRCFGALADLPALDLVVAGCEEVDKLDGSEARGDDLRQVALHLILQQVRPGAQTKANQACAADERAQSALPTLLSAAQWLPVCSQHAKQHRPATRYTSRAPRCLATPPLPPHTMVLVRLRFARSL